MTQPDSPPSADGAAPTPVGRTVLVIDDSRAIRMVIVATLRSRGLFEHYVEAKDGAEGLQLVASRSIDVILCDLQMPVLDGLAFLDRLRADKRYDSIPVLLMSATDGAENRVEGIERGANDYVIKPCPPTELCARVGTYLKLRVLQDELAAARRELAALRGDTK